jgi:hypothetical protein
MLNQGERFVSKSAALKKATAMRKKGYKAYVRQLLGPKRGKGEKTPVTKRSDQTLYWWATWERK